MERSGKFGDAPVETRCERAYGVLFHPERAATPRADRWGLGLSLLLGFGFAATALPLAFAHPYVIQDDARQHIFWMVRYLDPDALPADLMADYFQSVAPFGFKGLYWLAAQAGLEPQLFNKLLPPVLSAIAAAFGYGVARCLLPLPIAGVASALLLSQNLWMRDDLASGAPVAFAYPCFLAVLWAFLRRSPGGCAIAIALLGAFYPQLVLVAAGLLLLRAGLRLGRTWRQRGGLDWRDFPWETLRDRELQTCLAGLVAGFFVLLPYALRDSPYGPVLTLPDARAAWPSFFDRDWVTFWFVNRRSGMLPFEWYGWDGLILNPWLALSLPVLAQFPARFPPVRRLTRDCWVFAQLLAVSLGLFFLAHRLLFRLHLPNRYTEHSLRVTTAILGGIALTILLEALWRRAILQERRAANGMPGADARPARVGGAARGQSTGALRPWPRGVSLGLAGLLALGILGYPFVLFALNEDDYEFPDAEYAIGPYPELYEFLRQQPEGTLMVAIDDESDTLPAFTGRSLLVGPGFAMRYHVAYGAEMDARALDVFQGQYAADPAALERVARDRHVDLWILRRDAYDPDRLAESRWVRQFRVTETEPLSLAHASAIAALRAGQVPALLARRDRCIRFETDAHFVLDAPCLADPPPAAAAPNSNPAAATTPEP